ncbi:Maltose operon periplasmic protein [Vibrio scophthalmi]|uniref:MalM family protein n=1 Tax=Vibrio scophthalmi TaxID=45658 RepID=UPI000809654A|nr:MalM family protein [Vibrio scophthalmi]ANS87418.1 Maltose operon periplasmic protein [Vibrio scophthalmi]
MKKIATVLLGVSVLFGCSSHQDFGSHNPTEQSISKIEQIEWQQVDIPANFSFHISSNTQYLTNQDFSSPVAGFAFEVTEPEVTIEVSGIVKQLKVFAPNLALYDQNFNLIRNYNASYFDYDNTDFIRGDVLFGDIVLNLPIQTTKIYGLIYTTKQDLADTTELLHPAKAMAIAKRTVPPQIDNPIAQHVEQGEIRIALKHDSGLSSFIQSSKSASAPEIPVIATKTAVVALPETENYYHSSIKAAVAADDIPKALALLEEAKAIGIKDAQKVFVNAVNNR